MKKLIISAICLLALAAGVSSYAYYRSLQIVAKNSLAKANVEALTDVEISSSGEWKVTVHSSNSWTCKKGGSVCCPEFSSQSC